MIKQTFWFLKTSTIKALMPLAGKRYEKHKKRILLISSGFTLFKIRKYDKVIFLMKVLKRCTLFFYVAIF